MYIIDTITKLNKVFVAIAPLCSYVSGLVASIPMRAINKRLGRKITMIIGLAFVIASSFLFYFIFELESIAKIEVTLIIACILLGIGTSTTNICSFSLTSDLIGLNTECGAFVYGIMSFADKLANGIIIALIQQFNRCEDKVTTQCQSYYKQILLYIPAVVSVLTVLMIVSIWRTDIGGNRHEMITPERTPLVQYKAQSVNNECNEQTSLLV